MKNKTITVKALINAPVEKVWKLWTSSEHVTKWNNASDDWHTPSAENDLKFEGKFIYRMEAKDKSTGFDFTGTYTKIINNKEIEYILDDGRKVSILFEDLKGNTKVTEIFEPENKNPERMQREGWQAILDNFKKYVESN